MFYYLKKRLFTDVISLEEITEIFKTREVFDQRIKNIKSKNISVITDYGTCDFENDVLKYYSEIEPETIKEDE